MIKIYSNIDFKLYSCKHGQYTLTSVIKENSFTYIVYTDTKQCLFTNISQDKKVVQDMYESLEDMINTRTRETFLEKTPKGIDIEHLWNIYFKAKECFPDFTMLDTKAQFAILQRAFYYASKAKIKDIHTYAKEVIHVLHDKNLLSKFVYKKKEYTLLKKNYRDTKTQSGKVRRALYSLDYTDGLFRTSFKPFDLWNSLTRTSTSDDEDE